MLRVAAYKKTFGLSTILEIPELILKQGIYWLRGPNGAGKTTFLKSVAGLLPFEGEVFVHDISLRKQRRAFTASVNYAEAEPVYPTFLTGQDLIDFYVQTKKGDKRLVAQTAEAFGMNAYLKTKVSSYSSGMTKKLSLVLAFTGQPKLILLDEPFTTLDTEAVQTLYSLVKDAFTKGTGFCISSHQPLTLSSAVLLVQNQTITEEQYDQNTF
jgi:ABC-2 type transport system ATP-binding protein